MMWFLFLALSFAQTADTAVGGTGATGGTGGGGGADTGAPVEALGPTGLVSAASLRGDTGGLGCDTPRGHPGFLLTLAAFMVLARWEVRDE